MLLTHLLQITVSGWTDRYRLMNGVSVFPSRGEFFEVR